MPTAAILSTQLTTTRPFSLYIRGGLDVLKEPRVATGISYGAPIESIQMTEAGPGGVSSMDFLIDDPLLAVQIDDADDVQFYDNTNSVMLFRGFVDHWSYLPAFGGQGRQIKVSCVGVEVLLDWIKVLDVTASPTFPDILPYAIARVAHLNAPQLRAPMVVDAALSGVARSGNFAFPVGFLAPFAVGDNPYQIGTAPDLFGLSLREAIRTLWENSAWTVSDGPTPIFVTIDFYMGLRVWEDFLTFHTSGREPVDYTTLTISDTAAGAIVAEELDYANEPGDPVRAVYIKGGNAAGTGLFADGSGLLGRTEIIDDATILDGPTALNRAGTVFAASAPVQRGSFNLTDFTPTTTVHAGSLLTLTDATMGLSAVDFRIMQIDKTFNPSGRQNWRVAFGGLPPSAVRLTRKLTRDVSI